MMRLQDLSRLVGGKVTSQPDLEITGAASIHRASANEITFVCSPSHWQAFLGSGAAAAVVPAELASPDHACLVVDEVEPAFIEIAELFRPPIQRQGMGVSPQAIVAETARLADDVCVYPGAVIMDHVEIGPGSVVFPNVTIMESCRIGNNVRIFPGATLYENTVLGDRVIVHAGAVLGAFGFGYKSQTGVHQLSAQLGNVVIEDDVEIGANTTIDRGTYDSTRIGEGTKLDNLVMVGHNCSVGPHNLLCSQVGIAGSCQTGQHVVMGGQVGLADHLSIGNHVAIGAKSGLMHDIEDNQKYFGIPARPAREEMQILANRARLPELRKQVKQMEKQLAELSETVAEAQQPGDDAQQAA